MTFQIAHSHLPDHGQFGSELSKPGDCTNYLSSKDGGIIGGDDYRKNAGILRSRLSWLVARKIGCLRRVYCPPSLRSVGRSPRSFARQEQERLAQDDV